MQKIAFTGAHGTGKTTLVRALAVREGALTTGATVTPEVPRVICELVGDPTFFRRGKNSFAKQLTILLGQPVYEATVSAGDIVLCDRAILDHWAYTRILFPEAVGTPEAVAAEAMVRRHMKSYDALFYVPIEFAPEDDGTREGDAAFQRDIDGEIRRLLTSFGLRYETVRGAVEERVDLTLAALRGTLPQPS